MRDVSWMTGTTGVTSNEPKHQDIETPSCDVDPLGGRRMSVIVGNRASRLFLSVTIWRDYACLLSSRTIDRARQRAVFAGVKRRQLHRRRH